MPEVAISIRNLNKTFIRYQDQKNDLKALFANMFRQGGRTKFKSLDGVSMDIYKGEFFGIIGPNGGGKSTVLKIIAGIYDGDDGSEVNYAGRLVPFLELGVGFNPELTGRENIYLNGTILGLSIGYLSSKAEEIIDFAELRDFIDSPVKNYSSGMMLRLAFSIAIQTRADIFLLDEVVAVGDASFQAKSKAEIIKLKAEGKTIVLVSHSMDEIKRNCDRVAYINHGQLKYIGSPEEAVARYLKDIGQ